MNFYLFRYFKKDVHGSMLFHVFIYTKSGEIFLIGTDFKSIFKSNYSNHFMLQPSSLRLEIDGQY